MNAHCVIHFGFKIISRYKMSNKISAIDFDFFATSTLGWEKDEIAQSYIHHILLRAVPIVKRRNWCIGIFKEFYPRGDRLLGLNIDGGSEIRIRFRLPRKKLLFLPFPEVMCTVLHELAHCQCHRHDKKFWSLYDSLVKECETIEFELAKSNTQLYPDSVAASYSSALTNSSQSNSTRKRGRDDSPLPALSTPRKLGGLTPAPTSREALRELLAQRARERQQSFLFRQYCQDRGNAWFTENAPDAIPVQLSEANRVVEGSWRCPLCEYWNVLELSYCGFCSNEEEVADTSQFTRKRLQDIPPLGSGVQKSLIRPDTNCSETAKAAGKSRSSPVPIIIID